MVVAEPTYIRLEPGLPKALHFVDHAVSIVVLPDPLLGIDKPVRRLLFVVDEEDGGAVAKTYSITSQDHQAFFAPLLEGKTYVRYVFVITRRGDGFRTKYSVTQIPR